MRTEVHHVCALMHIFHIMMVHAGTCSAKDSLVGKGKEVAGGLMGKPGMKEEGECLQTCWQRFFCACVPIGCVGNVCMK